jgi:NAD(P)-dependent dehydrogenase (short-subunit alcohol dehydrogenase family)
MGEAIARLFAQEGAAVALIDVQAAKAKAIAEQIQAAGGRAIFIECDVRREDCRQGEHDRAVAEFGGSDDRQLRRHRAGQAAARARTLPTGIG